MSTRTINTLLAVEIYEFTGDEIGKLKNKHHNQRDFFEYHMPKYCLIKNGTIGNASDYLYWVESGEEKYILFNMDTGDRLLAEEISNAGLESLLENFDVRPIFENLGKSYYEEYNRTIPSAEYIIIELAYTTHRGYDYTEYDMYSAPVGYMDRELKPVFLKCEEYDVSKKTTI
jgi:hypothetical protein